MLITTGTLTRQSLLGEVIIVTGGGQGIGYEAARALAWLGATVVIAEIDKQAGKQAATAINQELRTNSVSFIHTDVGDEGSVNRLARTVLHTYDKVDVVLNNATVAPLGAVQDLPIAQWDASYRVNLRGPVLLARAFLPGMVKRQHGVFVCVSSTGVAFMGAYEIFKTAQVELANTLQAELEGTDVTIFTIGPGVAPTPTATAAIEHLASLYGQSTAEFYATVQDQFISVEAAGAGFAAAIALADQFAGQETASVPALYAAGIKLPDRQNGRTPGRFTAEQLEQIQTLGHQVYTTLAQESASWQQRSIFERQWLIRAFKKQAGMSTDQWLEGLEKLNNAAQAQDSMTLATISLPLKRLANYYGYLYAAAAGYVKDPAEREEQLRIVRGWQGEVERLAALLDSNGSLEKPTYSYREYEEKMT
jgi:NAD(P)-dependent dehydrogenase (short-subunit alcohol dehydrogenase family)